MRSNRIIFLLSCFLVIVLLIGIVHADIIQPDITRVYFEKNGAPYNFPVKYTVTCYGNETHTFPFTPAPPGSYQPSPIFRYSATCNGYGCQVYPQNYRFFGSHFDWCDLEGETNYQKFSLHNFSSTDITRCDKIPDRIFRIRDNDLEYYYMTPEYDACFEFRDNKTREIWAGRASFSSTVPLNASTMLLLKGRNPYYSTDDLVRTKLMANKSDISMNFNQYINYLETCDPVGDRKCPGWIIDDKPLKLFTEYRSLKNDVADIQKNPCDAFLVKADPSLIIPFKDQDPSWSGYCAQELNGCNYTAKVCVSRFTIPSIDDTGSTSIGTTPATPVSTTVAPVPSVTGKINTSVKTTVVVPATGTLSQLPSTGNQKITPVTITPVSGGSIITYRSPVETLYCTVLSLFRISCDAT